MPDQRKSTASFEVEILSTDGIWKLHAADNHPKPSRTSIKPASKLSRSGRALSSAVFACCTLILHGLLLGGIVMGTAGRPVAKRAPEIEGIALQDAIEGADTTVLVFLNSNSITPPDWSPDDLGVSSLGEMQREITQAVLASLVSTSLPDLGDVGNGTDENSPTEESTGDESAGRALLFGRYMGQIVNAD